MEEYEIKKKRDVIFQVIQNKKRMLFILGKENPIKA